MIEDKSFHDKRRHPRYEVDFIATLNVGITISGRGHTLNISQGGVGIVAPGLFSTIKPKRLNELLGSVISIFFPFESLIIEGQIAWIDIEKNSLGLSIFKASDEAQWEKVCKNG